MAWKNSSAAGKRIRETLADRYDRQNREAARLILTEPQRYAGLPYEWAMLWTEKKAASLSKRPAASITKGNQYPMSKRGSA